MSWALRKCTIKDIDTLRELSVRTYYETFSHLNTPEDIAAYIQVAFNAEKLMVELNDSNSECIMTGNYQGILN